jgi:pimeloyl-ACP methyl ester carboxylesterase
MERLEHRSLITSPYNLTYSYYTSPNFAQSLNPSVPTLLFIHGYPDDAYMWAGAVPTFLNLPYPFIVLDLLGFAGSSKPIDVSKYNYRNQASSIAQILDKEKVPNNVIPIGEQPRRRPYSITKHLTEHCRPRLGQCNGPALLPVP